VFIINPAPLAMRLISSRQWWFAVAASVAVSAVLVSTIRPGTSITDALTGYHLNPVLYLQELWRPWTDRIYLGLDTGAMQLVLFPDAVLYAGLSLIGLSAAASQRVVLFALFLTSGLSVSLLARTASVYLTRAQPVLAIAPIFYVCNLYVAYTIVGNSPTLWPYALLPALASVVCIAIRARNPIWMGVLAAPMSVLMAGSNPAVLIISCLGLLAFLIYVVCTDPRRSDALVAALRFSAVSICLGVVCNAFWLFPFVHYAKTTWLAGVFSESIAWHSSQANIPDILRLLGGEGFFGRSEDYGPAYPLQSFYRDHGLIDLISRIVPVVAISTLLFARARREPFLRCLVGSVIVVAFIASGAHKGPDGGAWTASLFQYLSERVQAFQIFRELEKWDSLIALSVALLCSYQAGIAGEFFRRFGTPYAHVPAVLIASISVISAIPILMLGPFRPQSMLSSIPPYWSTASEAFHLSPAERAAIFPKQYLPHFFWGEVLPDFAGIALQRPTAYSIASGSGSPSSASAFLLEVMYQGVAQDAPWESALLRRLNIGNLIEQRDAFYNESEGYKAPAITLSELAALPGLSLSKTHGALTDFRVSGTMPLLAVARPFSVAFNGPDMLRLFPLLRPDEVAISSPAAQPVQADLPGIYTSGDVASLAAEETPALAILHLTDKPANFRIAAPQNVQLFARTDWFVPWASHTAVQIDGVLSKRKVGDVWSQVAAFRASQGSHEVAPVDARLQTEIEVKVVDANSYQRTYERLVSSRDLGQLLSIDSTMQQIEVLATGRYSLRVSDQPTNTSRYVFPLSFSDGASKESGGGTKWCGNLPVVQEGGVAEDNGPSRDWYYDPGMLPFTLNGRIKSTWYERALSALIFNPFTKSQTVAVRGNLAAVGHARQITLWGVNGTPTGSKISLGVPAKLSLEELPNEVLAGPVYVGLVGSATNKEFTAVLPPGWSRIRLITDAVDALPNTNEVMNGFISFGAIGTIQAFGCGAQRSVRVVDEHRQRLELYGDANGDGYGIAKISIPSVPLDTVPSLSLASESTDEVSLSAIVHYKHHNSETGTYTVQFSAADPRRRVAYLTPGSESIPASSRITEVDVIATLSHARQALLSNPELTLSRTPIKRAGKVSVQGSLGSAGGAVLTIRSAHNALDERLVLSIYNPDPSRLDVSFSPTNGLYVGRSLPLEAGSVVRISEQYASVTFPVPGSVPGRELNAWRRQVHLFVGHRELEPSIWGAVAPFEFSLDGATLTAVVPVALASGVTPWHLTYIPDTWFAQSRVSTDTDEIRIPVEDGLTTIDGEHAPVGSHLTVVQSSRGSMSSGSDEPVSLDFAFAEKPSPADGYALPTIVLDGHPLRLHKSRYGWKEENVILAAGYHKIYNAGGTPTECLLLPKNLARPLMSGGRLREMAIRQSDWTATASVASDTGPLALVWRQDFSLGWQGVSHSERLPHMVADGYANAFILRNGETTGRIDYESGTILALSRAISGAGIAIALALLLWRQAQVVVRSRLVAPKLGYANRDNESTL